MSMTAGTVSISDLGVASGGGLARALYEQLILIYDVVVPPIVIPNSKSGVDIRRAQAAFANALAAGIVPYITANAKARIAAGQGGLQKTPNPNNADAATVGPVAAQDIAII